MPSDLQTALDDVFFAYIVQFGRDNHDKGETSIDNQDPGLRQIAVEERRGLAGLRELVVVIVSMINRHAE